MAANNKDPNTSQRLGALFKEFENVDVASELAKLREEIRQLRETLTPPKCVLIIGPDVERILRSL